MLRSTKTQYPQFDRALHRTRLFAHLDGHTGSSWLFGPAGSGKTVLAATWVFSRQLPCVWYHVTQEDWDPATFFLHFSQGVATLAGQGGMPALTPSDLPTLHDFARHYFQQFRARLKVPVTIVLDNLHNLPSSAPLMALLRDVLLPQSGSQLRVVLISREEPTASFAHLLAAGTLRVLNGTDLRLELAECAALARMTHATLSDQEVASLHWRTSGWVAGLPLLLAQTTWDDETTARIEEESTEAVFDYFGRQVFHLLSPEHRTFLMQVAHLPEITGKMAAELTGLTDTGRLLSRWERKQFFIAREGEGTHGACYRLHDLFRAFLLATARREWSAATLEQVRGDAATILERYGKIEQAAQLYHAMENWPALTRLLLTHAPKLLDHARFATLTTWLAWFPEPLLRADPWLSLWQGMALTFVQTDSAIPWFETALDHFVTHGPLEAAWNAWCGRLECAQLLQRGVENPTAWRSLYDQLLNQGPMPSGLEARILNSVLFLHLFGNPADPEVGGLIDRLMVLCREQPFYQKVAIYANIQLVAIYGGDHARITLFWGALSAPFPSNVPPILLLKAEWIRVMNAIVLSHDTDVRAGIASIRHLCQTCTFPPALWLLQELVSIMAAIALDNYAPSVPPDVIALAGNGEDYSGMMCSHMLGILHVGAGDYRQAILRFQTMVRGTHRMGFQAAHALATLDLAQAVFLLGDREEAWRLMERVERLATAHGNPALIVRHGQLATLLCLEENRRAEAIVWLERALSAMERSGHMALSGWGPGRAMRLVRLALEENLHVPFVWRVLDLWPYLRPPLEMQIQDNWPWPVRLRTLGGLSMDVRGKPLTFRGKSQNKPLDLLKLILARSGRKASVVAMADLLWPDTDGDAALGNFNTTLHRLRKMLDSPDCLLVEDREIGLNPAVCQLDLWVVEELTIQGDVAIQKRDGEAVARIFSRLLTVCRGAFLESEPENVWVIPARQKWRSQITRTISRIGHYLEDDGCAALAEDGYRRALEWDGLSEGMHQQLMRCLARQGKIPEAIVAYRRCRTLFQAVLGSTPSPETERIYKNLEGKGA